MDEVLKVFLAEASQSLDQCDAGLDRLRKSSEEDASALANVLECVGSIREMSAVLGLRQLHAVAADGITALHEVRDGGAGAAARILPMARNFLAQIRGVIDSLGQVHAEPMCDLPSLSPDAADSLPHATTRTESARVYDGDVAVLALKRPKAHKTTVGNADGTALNRGEPTTQLLHGRVDEPACDLAAPPAAIAPSSHIEAERITLVGTPPSMAAESAPAANPKRNIAPPARAERSHDDLVTGQPRGLTLAPEATRVTLAPPMLMPTADRRPSPDLDTRVGQERFQDDQFSPLKHRRRFRHSILVAVGGTLSVVVTVAAVALSRPNMEVDGGVLMGVPGIVDTGTLRIADRWVRLEGVQGATGAPLRAMQNYIGGREVVCRPTAADRYRCEVNGWDLSEAVLYNGGARATASAPLELLEAERKARDAQRGIWAAQ